MLGSANNPFNLPRDFVAPRSATTSEHTAAARRYIAAATSLLSTYRYILEAHPVEFLIQRPMDRLPAAWLAELPQIEHQLDLSVLLGEQPENTASLTADGTTTASQRRAQSCPASPQQCCMLCGRWDRIAGIFQAGPSPTYAATALCRTRSARSIGSQ